MNFQQLMLILKARYKIALFTMLAITLTTLAISLIVPPRYSAETDVVVDVKSQDPLSEIVMMTTEMPSYLPTQVDIINSYRVAEKVIKALKLDESQVVREKWLEDTEGQGQMLPWLANLVQKDLHVKPSRDSNVIMISYSSSDPNFSAAMANAFARAYMDTNVELKTEPAHDYADWFKDQSKDLRDNLEKAQAKLSAYQQKHGIVVTDERLDSENAKLNELTAQLATIEAMTADARSKQMSGINTSTLPDVTQNGLIQGLKGDIDRKEAALQDASGNLGKNHPQYKRMLAELNELKAKLAAETQHITSGFSASESVSREKEDTLRQLIAAQKQRLLDLRKQRDEVDVLVSEVNSAQKAYDSVSQRFTQTNLESQAKQTNISVLTPATAPIRPTSPLPVLYTIIAAVLGTFIGLGVALLMEMIDRRIRTLEDIELGIGLPVLARISRQPSNARIWVNQLRFRKPKSLEFAG